MIGILLAVVAILLGMIFKGTSLMVLLNPAALFIIFVGTAAINRWHPMKRLLAGSGSAYSQIILTNKKVGYKIFMVLCSFFNKRQNLVCFKL